MLALTTRAGEGAGNRVEVDFLRAGEGDGGGIPDPVPAAAAAARFRVLLDRESNPGIPDGECGKYVLGRLLMGEAKVGIEDMVDDLGRGGGGGKLRSNAESGMSSRSSSLLSSSLSRETSICERSSTGSCIGERGMEMDEGGVGTARDSRSRSIAISLFASERINSGVYTAKCEL